MHTRHFRICICDTTFIRSSLLFLSQASFRMLVRIPNDKPCFPSRVCCINHYTRNLFYPVVQCSNYSVSLFLAADCLSSTVFLLLPWLISIRHEFASSVVLPMAIDALFMYDNVNSRLLSHFTRSRFTQPQISSLLAPPRVLLQDRENGGIWGNRRFANLD